jgi:hypothetical protein
MRRRISDQERPDVFIPYDFRPQRIMTMHGLGLDIVRTNSRLLGLQDNFDVMTDPKLQACLFRDAAHSLGYGEKEAQEAARVRRTSEPVDPNSESVTIGNEYEPRRVCRRLQLLRGWSHGQAAKAEVFT